FNQDDLELTSAIASQAAMAIENAMLFDSLKKANQEIRDRQEQLIESEKLSALGRLAAGVAHEINNPMTSILGYSQLSEKMLSKESMDPASIRECFEFIKIVESEAIRCQSIVQTLLQFGRKKEQKMSLVDINQVVEASLVIAKFHIKRSSIEIQKDLAGGLPKTTADQHQLQQVFLNMIINARDAMENSGGILRISTRAQEGWISVKFADTGCGIPPDKIDEIFKPLYTTKGEGKGTGLGLSVTQDIIEAHQGAIDVESEVGKGTMFTIRLPVR
ncbi:MAG: ATP-binding protein, partial [Candidatus Omnitrophota bacterium]|nr:ATP-binding protein [Candidatus Omnitrophota bacterium]